MANSRNDDEQIVDRILKSPDHFSVLCLKITCSKKELTTAYRNLARKVHSDKNKSPQADEAFKVLQKAYNTLKDPFQRMQYVQELRSTSQRATSNTGTYYRRYADTQSKRQRTPFTYTRETDENNTDPFRQRTQFTSSKEAKTQEQPKAKIGLCGTIGLCLLAALVLLLLLLLKHPDMRHTSIIAAQEQRSQAIRKTFELQKTETFNRMMIPMKLKIPSYVQGEYQPKSVEKLIDLWEEIVVKEFSPNDDQNILSHYFIMYLMCLFYIVVIYALRTLVGYFCNLP